MVSKIWNYTGKWKKTTTKVIGESIGGSSLSLLTKNLVKENK